MNSTVNYPDGSTLVTTVLSDSEIETIFQYITAVMLGIVVDPLLVQVVLTSGLNTASVNRTSLLYSGENIVSSGLPTDTVITNVNTISSTITLSSNATSSGSEQATVTDPMAYSKVRIGWQKEGQPSWDINEDVVVLRCETEDTDYSRLHDNIDLSSTGLVITQQDVFTRVWKTIWSFYGPNCTVRAKLVQAALQTVPFIDYYLGSNSLYVNPSIREPKRFKESFQGQWWPRADLTVEFNEQITQTFTVGSVRSVEVLVYDKNGKQADFIVTT